MVVLAITANCSSALDNKPSTDTVATGQSRGPAEVKLRFPKPELAAKHDLAKAAPNDYDAVFAYAKGVADFCLASLVDKGCASCSDSHVKYKPLSELNPFYWPIIEDVLVLLTELRQDKGLVSEQMEPLIAVSERLLWLAGRSTEGETLIEDYARAHPDALAVVKRRLELLHESGNVAASESQCARSRARMKSALEAARLELLRSCVALHPSNSERKDDPPDFALYLPRPATDEEQLYRTHLVQRCVADLGDIAGRCDQACACEDKQQLSACKRGCRDCRNEMNQEMRGCQRFGGSPAVAGAAHQPKDMASRPSLVDTASDPQPTDP
jgi:hypothetical protein